ncbi:hypothetical protein RF11_07030 [Thelohanellus kitauei]|uniref:Uncharacterized protein n=1 Tax=Thelohanellus kitauei TaxID=669202 RepID=A0A0C2JAH4_THEKT|nr:hypothetical protein RF11_07030 [Thelohanellus kitauei]
MLCKCSSTANTSNFNIDIYNLVPVMSECSVGINTMIPKSTHPTALVCHKKTTTFNHNESIFSSLYVSQFRTIEYHHISGFHRITDHGSSGWFVEFFWRG